jgi:undecaprenyl diphosphate synthase
MSTPNAVPEHIAIVMDGNGRWAQARGQARINGHRRGVEVVREVTSLCAKAGVSFLTLFAFSSENWRRPADEVTFLKKLLATSLEKEFDRLHKNNIRLNVIGDVTPFGPHLEKNIENAKQRTDGNTGLTLTIALNYGARWEISAAAKTIAVDCVSGKLKPEDISESLFNDRLTTGNIPDPDLFIRTGGEIRLSNFLLWQLAYTELFFTDTLWPDFDETVFNQALEAFNLRQRRFGQTGEQVGKKTSR